MSSQAHVSSDRPSIEKRSSALHPTSRLSVARATGRTRLRAAARQSWMVPVGAVLASRVLVLAAGAVGAATLSRDPGWQAFDPARVTLSFGALGNLLAAPAVRWDSLWYLGIAQHGYSSAASTAFFPLYPLLTEALGFVTGSAALAAVIISLAAFTVALVLLHRLTELELGRRAADATVILLAFAPLSLFFTAAYTESLFLALAVGCVYAARRDRWAVAGILGALAAATRVTGVLLVAVVLLPGADDGRDFFRRRLQPLRAWMLAVPFGLGAYLGSLALRGYGWLAPFRQQASATHLHRFVGPLAAVGQAASAAWRGAGDMLAGHEPLLEPHALGAPFSAGAESIYLFGVLLLAVLALALCLRRLPAAYAAFAFLALVVSISSPVSGDPLKSLDRYTLTIFPLWMAAGVWVNERRLLRPALVLSAALLVFFTVQFSAWTFVA